MLVMSVLGPYTAWSYIISIAIFGLLGERYYYKHHGTGKFDDRLTEERMEKARQEVMKIYAKSKSDN